MNDFRPNGSVLKYFLGLAVSVILLGVSGLVGHLQGRINTFAEIQIRHGERIATLDAQFAAITAQLIRIEAKTDRLYERIDRRANTR